jgi:hypothetical protein
MKEERVWRPQIFSSFFWTLFCNSWSQLVYLYHVLFVTLNIWNFWQIRPLAQWNCQKRQPVIFFCQKGLPLCDDKRGQTLSVAASVARRYVACRHRKWWHVASHRPTCRHCSWRQATCRLAMLVATGTWSFLTILIKDGLFKQLHWASGLIYQKFEYMWIDY